MLDPFGGAGTVGLVAERLGRDSIIVELNSEYAEMAHRRILGDAAQRGATVRVDVERAETGGDEDGNHNEDERHADPGMRPAAP